jgi:hypothetical protein
MNDEAWWKIGLYLDNNTTYDHDRLSRIKHDKLNKSEAMIMNFQ